MNRSTPRRVSPDRPGARRRAARLAGIALLLCLSACGHERNPVRIEPMIPQRFSQIVPAPGDTVTDRTELIAEAPGAERAVFWLDGHPTFQFAEPPFTAVWNPRPRFSGSHEFHILATGPAGYIDSTVVFYLRLSPPPPLPPFQLSIQPDTARVALGESLSLRATITGGDGSNSVHWNVVGGDTRNGTITESGLTASYRAPDVLPDPPEIRVRVASTIDPTGVAEARITLFDGTPDVDPGSLQRAWAAGYLPSVLAERLNLLVMDALASTRELDGSINLSGTLREDPVYPRRFNYETTEPVPGALTIVPVNGPSTSIVIREINTALIAQLESWQPGQFRHPSDMHGSFAATITVEGRLQAELSVSGQATALPGQTALPHVRRLRATLLGESETRSYDVTVTGTSAEGTDAYEFVDDRVSGTLQSGSANVSIDDEYVFLGSANCCVPGEPAYSYSWRFEMNGRVVRVGTFYRFDHVKVAGAYSQQYGAGDDYIRRPESWSADGTVSTRTGVLGTLELNHPAIVNGPAPAVQLRLAGAPVEVGAAELPALPALVPAYFRGLEPRAGGGAGSQQ